MLAVFLIALGTGLAAGCLYLNTSEEIPRVMAIATLAICFGLDLIVAPWPIQLLILLLVLFSNRNLSFPDRKGLG